MIKVLFINSKISERKTLRHLTILEKQYIETKSLPYKRTRHESNKSNSSTHSSCFPTTKYVCEDTDYWAAKENHPYGERTYPCCKEIKWGHIMNDMANYICTYSIIYTIYLGKY